MINIAKVVLDAYNKTASAEPDRFFNEYLRNETARIFKDIVALSDDDPTKLVRTIRTKGHTSIDFAKDLISYYPPIGKCPYDDVIAVASSLVDGYVDALKAEKEEADKPKPAYQRDDHNIYEPEHDGTYCDPNPE